MSMNKWNGIGNLTRDPEYRESANGTSICTFSIAVNRPKDKDGNSKADFIPVKALGKQAEVCSRYLHKGSRIGVVGTLTSYTYETDDGQRHFKMEVLMQDLTFLGDAGQGQGQPRQQQSTGGQTPTTAPDPDSFTEVDDDELPF